jgi:hypothetical protein
VGLFGPERLVTQSYGNVLRLDGKPALLSTASTWALGDELQAAAVPDVVRDLEDRTSSGRCGR